MEGSQIPYPARCHIFLGKLSPPPQAHALHRPKTRVSRMCPNTVALWYLVPASGHGQPIGALKGRGFNEGDLYPHNTAQSGETQPQLHKAGGTPGSGRGLTPGFQGLWLPVVFGMAGPSSKDNFQEWWPNGIPIAGRPESCSSGLKGRVGPSGFTGFGICVPGNSLRTPGLTVRPGQGWGRDERTFSLEASASLSAEPRAQTAWALQNPLGGRPHVHRHRKDWVGGAGWMTACVGHQGMDTRSERGGAEGHSEGQGCSVQDRAGKDGVPWFEGPG